MATRVKRGQPKDNCLEMRALVYIYTTKIMESVCVCICVYVCPAMRFVML